MGSGHGVLAAIIGIIMYAVACIVVGVAFYVWGKLNE